MNGTISDLQIRGRTYWALRNNDIETLDQLCALHQWDVLRLPGVGKVGLQKIHDALAKLGRALRDDDAPLVKSNPFDGRGPAQPPAPDWTERGLVAEAIRRSLATGYAAGRLRGAVEEQLEWLRTAHTKLSERNITAERRRHICAKQIARLEAALAAVDTHEPVTVGN